MQRTLLELQRRWGRTPETLVKAWSGFVQHSSTGRQQERVLVATELALYRCTFNHRDGAVKEVLRSPWSGFRAVHLGWSEALSEQFFALRLLNRRARTVAASALLQSSAFTTSFWSDSVADNGVLLTFGTLIPPHIDAAGPEAGRCYQRETCCEVALVAFALMLRAQADCVCDLRRALTYFASFPLVAAIHRAAGYGREENRERSVQAAGGTRLSGPGPESGEQPATDPWEAPELGELPKTKLATRRCY